MIKHGLYPKALLALFTLLLSSCGGKNSGSLPSSFSENEVTLSSSSEISIPEQSEESLSSSIEEESSFEELTTLLSSEQSSSSESEETSSYAEESSEESSYTAPISSETIYDHPDVSNTPWASLDFNKYGIGFRNALASLIEATGSKTVGYSELNDVLSSSDASPSKASHIVPFYHPDTDSAGRGDWNKEHVWPNSRGAGKSKGDPGADPQMIRPTLTSDNSSRGNNFYGISMLKTWDPASFGYSAARGEAARIIFYTATRYALSHGLSLSNNPNDSTGMNTMGVLKYMVQWNHQYPVTDMEKRRNDYLDKNGFARNPFIDFPELADYIWSEEGLRNRPLNGEQPSVPDDAYTLIDDISDVHDGDKLVIVAEAADEQGRFASVSPVLYNSYYLTADLGRIEENYYYPSSVVHEWTVSLSEGCFVFTCEGLTLGVSINGTYKNLVAQRGLTTNHLWQPGTMGENGKLSLKNVGTDSYMEFYRGDFSAYRADNGVYLFRK